MGLDGFWKVVWDTTYGFLWDYYIGDWYGIVVFRKFTIESNK
jgi:hypothetical protein